MTDTPDNTNEENVLPVHATLHPNAIHAVSAEDFTDDGDTDEMESDDLESINADLTPNDIFGLDPLDVLTLEEVAEYLKVSPAAARRAMKEQNLPGRSIGGDFRFLRDAVANWLRGQEAPAVEQQKARDDYSKSKPDYSKPKQDEGERFSRPPQRPYQSEQSGEYRPRQRFPEGGQQQYGNQYGRRGGQSEGGGQYGGGQQGGNQYGGGQSGGGGQYGGGSESGSSYSRPPRRPFRPADGGGQEGYGGGGGGGATGGYGGDAAGGTRFGAGGYAGGGQRFGGGPKRKNKRQVFDNERGKRLDRRKEGEAPEGQE